MRDDASSGSVRFGSFRLDLEVGELWDGGETVPLRPKAMAVLVELVRHAGTLVPRERILDAVWGGAHMESDTALHGTIREVRAALGDDASAPRFVETVHRRGYRFVASVRPAAEEELRRFAGAGHWTMRVVNGLRGRAVAAALVAFGAFLLLLWTRGPAPRPGLPVVEASEAVLRARHLVTTGDSEDVYRAAEILRDAVERDDGASLAWAGLAAAELRLGHYEKSGIAARHALELQADSADAYRVLAQLSLIAGNLEQAEAHALRALELDPATGKAHHAYGLVLASSGRIDDAIEVAQTARALAPTIAVVESTLARYLLFAGRYQEAIRAAEHTLELDPRFTDSALAALDVLQAACWAQGDLPAARDAMLRIVVAIGAPDGRVVEWRQAPAGEGLAAALRWRVDYYLEEQASFGNDRRVRAAVLLAQLGDTEAAIEQLRQIRGPAPALRLALQDPRLRDLAARPEVQRLTQAILAAPSREG